MIKIKPEHHSECCTLGVFTCSCGAFFLNNADLLQHLVDQIWEDFARYKAEVRQKEEVDNTTKMDYETMWNEVKKDLKSWIDAERMVVMPSKSYLFSKEGIVRQEMLQKMYYLENKNKSV